LGGGKEDDIRVLDVASPTSPVLLSRIPMKGVTDFEAKGNSLYVCSNETLAVVDCSNPRLPKIVTKGMSNRNTPTGPRYRNVKMAGDYLCLTDFGNIYLFDLSNAFAPSMLSKVDVSVRIDHFVAGDGFACVGAGHHTGPYYSLITWKDPRSPTVIRSCDSGLPVYGWEKRLLLPDKSRPWNLMDMSNPDNPKLVACMDWLPGRRIKCGSILFALHSNNQFSAIDLSDEMKPKHITRSTRRPVRFYPSDMASHAKTLYVEHPDLGLHFYDVSNPAEPVLIYESCPNPLGLKQYPSSYRQK